MKCPKCKKKIEWVRVYGECWQRGELKKSSNEIEYYDSVEEITEITDIECPECNASIIDFVEP